MERTASEKVLLSRFEAGKTVKTKRWTVRARLKKIAALASARVRSEREPRFCEIQNGASHELTTFRPVLTWNWADLCRVEVCGLLLPSTHFCQLCRWILTKDSLDDAAKLTHFAQPLSRRTKAL